MKMKKTQFLTISAVFLLLTTSCNNYFLTNGTSMLTHTTNPFASSDDTKVDDSMSASFKVNALALAQEIGPELKENLKLSGLSEEQSDLVIEEAYKEFTAQVSAISLPDTSFMLHESLSDDYDPILLAAPYLTGGAIKALGSEELGLDDANVRLSMTSTIVDSTFTSLNGRTAHLEDDSFSNLSSKMTGQAVQNIEKAGLGSEQVANATYAITSGAIGALSKSGTPNTLIGPVAQSIVSGTVSQLSKITWSSENSDTSDQLSEAISKATEGAVSKISTISLEESESLSLVGEISASSMESLKTLQESGLEIDLSETLKQISKGAVSGLKSASLTGDKLGPALESISSSMVASIEKSGIESDEISDGVGAIASGAISGLSTTGMSETELNDGNAIEKVMSGATKSLTSIEISDATKAASIGTLVDKAVSSLNEIGFADDSKANAIDEILDGTIKNFKNAGLNSQSLVQIAAKEATKGAARALTNAGFNTDSISNITGNIVKKGISLMIETGDASNSEELKTAAKELAQGAVEGIGFIANQSPDQNIDLSGAISNVLSSAIDTVSNSNGQNSISIDTSDIGDISLEIASGAIEGAAIVGTSTSDLQNFESTITNVVVEDLRDLGLDETNLSYIESQVEASFDEAETLATQINSGSSAFSQCKDTYPDTATDIQIIDSIRYLPNPILCVSEKTEECPLPRSSTKISIEWDVSDILFDLPENLKMCELQRVFHEDIKPGEFEILTTDHHIYETEPTFIWGQSEGVSEYFIKIATDSACTNMIQRHKITMNDIRVSNLTFETEYYLCVYAKNVYNKIIPASNNPINFKLTTSPSQDTSDDSETSGDTTEPPETYDDFSFVNLTGSMFDITNMNYQSYDLDGYCSYNNENVIIKIDDQLNFTTTCTANVWMISSLDVSSLPESEHIEILLEHSDGTEVYKSSYEAKKDTIPANFNFTVNTIDKINFNNISNFLFEGVCNEDGFVDLTYDYIGSTYYVNSLVCDDTGWTHYKDMRGLFTEGDSITFTATHYDQVGNISAPQIITLFQDTTPPTLGLTGFPNIIDATNQSSVTFSGTCSEHSDVKIELVSHIPNSPDVWNYHMTICTGGVWSKTIDVTSQPDSNPLDIHITLKDYAGNESPPEHRQAIKNTSSP